MDTFGRSFSKFAVVSFLCAVLSIREVLCDIPPICGRDAVDNFKRSIGNAAIVNKKPPPPHVPFIVSIQTFDLSYQPVDFDSRVDEGSAVGTILAPRVVMSACRCFALRTGQVGQDPSSIRNPKQFGMLAGTEFDESPYNNTVGQLRFAWKILVHPNCELLDSIFLNDLAILVIEIPFEFTPRVQPVLIKSSREIEDYIKNTTAVCVVPSWGWAWRRIPGALDEELYGLEIEELQLCPRNPALLSVVPPGSLLCGKSLEFDLWKKKTGDIGAPILCLPPSRSVAPSMDRVVLLAVKSSEDNSTYEGTSLYTKMDPYIEWIKETVANAPVPTRKAVSTRTAAGSATGLLLIVTLARAWNGPLP